MAELQSTNIYGTLSVLGATRLNGDLYFKQHEYNSLFYSDTSYSYLTVAGATGEDSGIAFGEWNGSSVTRKVMLGWDSSANTARLYHYSHTSSAFTFDWRSGNYPHLRIGLNQHSRHLFIGAGSQANLGTSHATIGVTASSIHYDPYTGGHNYFNHYNTTGNTYFNALGGGGVGIRTTTLGSHALAVNGSMSLGGVHLEANVGNYGSIAIRTTKGGMWYGLQLGNGNGMTVMSDGSHACGLYNDNANYWILYHSGDETRLYHNGTSYKLQTMSDGVNIIGRLNTDSLQVGDGTEIGKITISSSAPSGGANNDIWFELP